MLQQGQRGIISAMLKYHYLIILIYLCLTGGCASSNEIAETKRGQAIDSYNQGNNLAAIKDLEQAENISSNQKNNYLLGKLYYENKNFPKAIEHLEKSKIQDYRLAYAYYKNSQVPQSINICRQVIANGYSETNPHDWQEIINLTERLKQIGLLIDAKKQELLTSPANSFIYAQLAQLYNKNNRPDLAIACAKRSINLYPNENSAYTALAKAYAAQKQYDLAISCLNTYIKNTEEEYK